MRLSLLILFAGSLTVGCGDDDSPPASTCGSDCDCPTGSRCTFGPDGNQTCTPAEFNPCRGEPDLGRPDAFVAPVELGFDPSNLRGSAHGKPFPAVGIVTEARGDCWVNTDDGGFSCGESYFEVHVQPSAPPPMDTVGVFYVRSLDVGRVTLRVQGSRPGIIVALEDVRIQGDVVVDAAQALGPLADDGPSAGTGPGAGSYHLGSSLGSASGGSFCSPGGLGGTADDSTRGATYGSATCEPLLGGSSGGTTGESITITGSNGGDSGGALQIVSGTRIEITSTGRFFANGEQGRGADEGGGGGSGGMILLEAPVVQIGGRLLAGGGSGGLTQGGAGASGTSYAEDGVLEFGDAGGGGGGFGWMRINTEDGESGVAVDAVVSPDPSIECFSVGTLHPKTSPPAPSEPVSCETSFTLEDACDACLAPTCCDELQACDTDELCRTCWRAFSPGPACSGYQPLTDLETCVAKWCPTRCD